MKKPGQNRAQLPQYRSQVGTHAANKSPVLVGQNRYLFKQSIVNDQSKKHSQLDKKSSNYNVTRKYDGLLSERSQVKGYEHLLPSKGKKFIKSPLNTYRSRQNLSPQTLRENIYVSDNESELQENRSAKFISNLREQINSPKQKYSSPVIVKGTQITELKLKQKFGSSMTTGIRTNKHQQTVLESRVNHTDYYGQPNYTNFKQLNDQQHFSPQTVKRQPLDESQQLQLEPQSPQRLSFERRLLDKCKSLQIQLNKSEKQVTKLILKLQTVENKHNSEINLIKNQLMLQKSRQQSQLTIAKRQLQELQKSFKNLEKTKHFKQKTLSEEIAKYSKSLKQSQQQKNKLVLQFESIVREKVSVTEKKCSDQSFKDFERLVQQNKTIKRQLSQKKKQLQEVLQEKQDIFEESKLLHLELENYTRWNDEQGHENRILQRKMYEVLSQNKLMLQEKELLQSSINQLQQTLSIYKGNINSLQTVQNSLNQQVQVLKFQLQSVKSQMQSRQKQFIKQKGTNLQEMQILEAKCIASNREKLQICEELDYQRKELANMRRLVDSLEERLEEQRRQCQQMQLLNDKYELQMKEKAQSLSKAMQTIIYRDNQILQQAKILEQLQQQIRLARTQKSYSRHQYHNHQSTIQQLNESQPSKITEYQEKVQLLQNQITQLMSRFNQQKSSITKNYSLKEQQLKKKLINVQKEIFRKQQAALDDKKKHTAQINKHQQKITLLQDQLTTNKNQIHHLNEQLDVKQIQIKHLTIKIQELQSAYQTQLDSKQQQLNDIKNLLHSQRDNQLSALLKIVDTVFDQLNKNLNLTGHKQGSQQNGNNLSSSKQDQELRENINSIAEGNQIGQSLLTINKKQSAQNKSRQSSAKKQRQNSPHKKITISQSPIHNKKTFLNYLKHFNQHELTMQITSKTKEITSMIKMINKKVHLYEFTIHSLEESLQSQPIRIHQKYIRTISELQKKIYIQENTNDMKQAELTKQLKEEKDFLSRQVQRIKSNLQLKQEEILEYTTKLQTVKKTEEQLKEKIQLIEKENRKLVKKLNSEIEQYKNLYTSIMEQQRIDEHDSTIPNKKPNNYSFGSNLTTQLPLNGQSSQVHKSNHKSNQKQSTLYSMTTINQQRTKPFKQGNFPQQNTPAKLQNTPVKTIYQPQPNLTNQTVRQNSSLQQLLQSRLNELTQENRHLSNQLSCVNTQLLKEKEMFIELNAVVRELQTEIQKMANQNDKIRSEWQNISQEHNQLIEQLNFLQQHNNELQQQIQSKSAQHQNTLNQLQKANSSLSQTLKANQQLHRQVQTINQEQAQKYVDFKKLQDQITINQNQLNLFKIQKQQQNLAFSQQHQKLSAQLKQESQKRSIIQNIYHQLLQWIQQQPYTHSSTPYHLTKITSTHKLYDTASQFALNQHQPQKQSPIDLYQSQTISELTSTFTSQLSNLQHTIQQLITINQSLKNQIQRQKSLNQQNKLQLIKRQTQIIVNKDKTSALENTLLKRQIQIEEWKFICQTSTLNKSLTFQNKSINQLLANKNKFTQSTFTNSHCPQSKHNKNIQPNLCPEKGTSNSKTTKSPLKIPPKLTGFQHTTSNNNFQQQMSKRVQKPLLRSIESNLQNSVDSIMSVGQFYQIQKGKHFCNDSAQMSFF